MALPRINESLNDKITICNYKDPKRHLTRIYSYVKTGKVEHMWVWPEHGLNSKVLQPMYGPSYMPHES